MFVETGDGEGLRKAITTSKIKDTIVGLMIIKTTDDIATVSKEHPNIQIRYCVNINMFQCRTIRDPIPAFLKTAFLK